MKNNQAEMMKMLGKLVPQDDKIVKDEEEKK